MVRHTARFLGFTLLELLVVISIIGILVAMGAASFSVAQKQGRDARRRADMKSYQNCMEQCYSQENTYDSAKCHNIYKCNGLQDPLGATPTYPYNLLPSATGYTGCGYMENGKGNSADNAFVNSGTNWFCVKNLQ